MFPIRRLVAACSVLLLVLACGPSPGGTDGGKGGGSGGGTGGVGGGAGGGATGCTGQLIDCGGSCVDPAVDPQHCGTCSKVCTALQTCQLGTCVDNCGNSQIDGTEECDNGNQTDGDGCDSTCHTETGWTCIGAVCTPDCGDGMKVGPEQCDDNNTTATDGCDSTCHIEPGYVCSGTPSVCSSPCDPSAIPDDQISCTIDSCGADGGTLHTPDDSLCSGNFERCFRGAGCAVPDLTAAVITEFTLFGEQYIEIYNPTNDAGSIARYTFRNQTGTLGYEVYSLTGSSTDPVVVDAKSYFVGAANPPVGGNAPAEADFYIGLPGTAFNLSDAGDNLSFYGRDGGLFDRVDFKTPGLVTGHNTIAPGQFPALGTASTQLDSTKVNTTANDNGSNWCTTFRAPHSLGAANHSCEEVVINEVLYDFQNIAVTTDEGNTFVELAAPGGTSIAGFQLRAMNGDAGTVVNGYNQLFAAGTRVPPNGFYVVADSTTGTNTNVPNADLTRTSGIPGNGNGGNTIVLNRADGGLADKLAYGPTSIGEGQALEDLDPKSISFSASRNALSIDTNANKTDFSFDMTPTPGEVNGDVVPEIISITPGDAGAAVSASNIVVVAKDVANLLTINGGAPTSREVVASFAGAETATCSFTSLAQQGRGEATLLCIAPAHIDPVSSQELGIRGDFTLSNPVFFGNSATTPSGWTYVAAINEYELGEEADNCRLVSPTALTTTSGTQTGLIEGAVKEVGVTEGVNSNPSVQLDIGYGPANSDPRVYGNGWIWKRAAFKNQVGDHDTYNTTLTTPTVSATTTFLFAARVSLDDGVTWTYCDRSGAGTAEDAGTTAGSTFNAANLGTWTVNP